MPPTIRTGGRHARPALATLTLQPPLIIVLQGHSVPGGNGTHKPALRVAALRPAATVYDECVGGTTILDAIANVSSQVTPHYDASNPGRCAALLCETISYVADIRGEWGDGTCLTDPDGVGTDYYNLTLTWRTAVRNAGFLAFICTAPDAYETTANPLTNNAKYQQAEAKAHALIRANAAQYDRVIDVAADSAFQDSSNTTYYDPTRIHLTDPVGWTRLGDDFSAGMP